MAYTCYFLLLQKLYVLPQRLIPGRGKTDLLLGKEHRIITNYNYQGLGAPCTVKFKLNYILLCVTYIIISRATKAFVYLKMSA